jgi:hypothetical protein
MARVRFVENRLRAWTPALAESIEDEIRRAAALDSDPGPLDCRIHLEDGATALSVRILLERGGWGARFVVPFPSARGEVLSSAECVLRERALA